MFNQNNGGTFGNFDMNNQVNNAPTVKVIYGRNTNSEVLYLDNGMIIDKVMFDTHKQVVQKGALQQTNDPNLAFILNSKGNRIGEFRAGVGPTIYNQNNGSQMNNNLSGLVDVSVPATGGIVIGGGNTQTNNNFQNMGVSMEAPVQQKQAPKVQQVEDYEMIPGYEFKPVPTTYTDLKYIPIGKYMKYEIIIKKDENMDTKSHSNLYQELKTESQQLDPTLIGIFEDIVLDVNNSSSIALAVNITQTTKNKHIIFDGISMVYGINSIRANTGNVVPNDVCFEDDNKSYYTNLLADAALRTRSLEDLLQSVENSIKGKPQEIFVKRGIIEIILEEYNIVEDIFKVDVSKVKSLSGLVKEIRENITGGVEDISKLNEYEVAYKNIYTRLTNPKSLEAFKDLGYLTLAEPKDSVIEGLGLVEKVLCLSTRDNNIITELTALLDNNSDLSTYLITENTPNLRRVISDLMTNNVRFEKTVDKEFKIDELSTNPYQMVLYVLGSKFKIYKKKSDYYITRIPN